ncbi:MAG: hypothetical protein CMJ18_05370 [Phycisphaeraceae bacterium]|nr:hypothetical protein [Phycisphaeraceae bacterium]
MRRALEASLATDSAPLLHGFIFVECEEPTTEEDRSLLRQTPEIRFADPPFEVSSGGGPSSGRPSAYDPHWRLQAINYSKPRLDECESQCTIGVIEKGPPKGHPSVRGDNDHPHVPGGPFCEHGTAVCGIISSHDQPRHRVSAMRVRILWDDAEFVI